MSVSSTSILLNLPISQMAAEMAPFTTPEETSGDLPECFLGGDAEDAFKLLLDNQSSPEAFLCPPLPQETSPPPFKNETCSFAPEIQHKGEDESSRMSTPPPTEGKETFQSTPPVSSVNVNPQPFEPASPPQVLTESSNFQALPTSFIPDPKPSQTLIEPMKPQNTFFVPTEPPEEMKVSLSPLPPPPERKASASLEVGPSNLIPEKTDRPEGDHQKLTTITLKDPPVKETTFDLQEKESPVRGDLKTQDETKPTIDASPLPVEHSQQVHKPSHLTTTRTDITPVIKQIAERFSLVKSLDENGTPFLRLQLYPEHLGVLEVKMTFHEGELFLHFTGEILTMDLLQRHAQQLTQALGEHGFQLTSDQMAFGFSNSRENPHPFFDPDTLLSPDLAEDSEKITHDTPSQAPPRRVNILVESLYIKPTTQGDLALC